MENISEEKEDFCIKYPNDSMFLILKIIFSISLIMIFSYLIFQSERESELWHYVLFIVIVLVMIESLYHVVNRLLKYDEICIEKDYFLVKKDNKIISKTKICDIEILEKRPWFEFFGISWIIVKYEEKWLFQYSTNELIGENNKKIINRLKEGVKLWEQK